MNYRTIAFIFVIFSSVSIGLVLHTQKLQQYAIQASALHLAKIFGDMITEFRTLYTSEVITAAERHGLNASHDFIRKGTIPLPVTLSMMLGKRIGEDGTGAAFKLYSPYPFPWQSNRSNDIFSKTAWKQLLLAPSKPYYLFTKKGNTPVLRYAIADIMHAGCIDCHNQHPDSPKKDWKTGDIRGVLEITIPLDRAAALSNLELNNTIIIYLILSIIGITSIILMIRNHNEHTSSLESAVARRTRQLEIERNKANKANKAKSEFLARMSHELRTPLNAILGFAQLLKKEIKENTSKQNCEQILLAGNHLLQLINETLDLKRIESGELSLDMKAIHIDKLIIDALEMTTPLTKNLNIQFKPYIKSGTWVLADEKVLKQIIINLLSNAIKYNKPNGYVNIETSHEADNN
ncbi:MAG: DUF3365 domain-containing protein, partial [Gammaproteobacteria bacterium]|nr:DUF3365 domain-containing protein [Gammaproteobacteria bacterium]